MNTVHCKIHFSDVGEQSLQREVKGSGRQYYESLSESLIEMKKEVNSIVTVEVEKAKQQAPAQDNKRLQDKDSSEGKPMCVYSTICNTAKKMCGRKTNHTDTTVLLDSTHIICRHLVADSSLPSDEELSDDSDSPPNAKLLKSATPTQ